MEEFLNFYHFSYFEYFTVPIEKNNLWILFDFCSDDTMSFACNVPTHNGKWPYFYATLRRKLIFKWSNFQKSNLKIPFLSPHCYIDTTNHIKVRISLIYDLLCSSVKTGQKYRFWIVSLFHTQNITAELCGYLVNIVSWLCFYLSNPWGPNSFVKWQYFSFSNHLSVSLTKWMYFWHNVVWLSRF